MPEDFKFEQSKDGQPVYHSKEEDLRIEVNSLVRIKIIGIRLAAEQIVSRAPRWRCMVEAVLILVCAQVLIGTIKEDFLGAPLRSPAAVLMFRVAVCRVSCPCDATACKCAAL
jgi:hypothetical protein